MTDSSLDAKIDELKSQVEALQAELAERQAQNEKQRILIESLEKRDEIDSVQSKLEKGEILRDVNLDAEEHLHDHCQPRDGTKHNLIKALPCRMETICRNEEMEHEIVNDFVQSRTKQASSSEACVVDLVSSLKPEEPTARPPSIGAHQVSVSDLVSELHRRLLVEESDHPDVESLISSFVGCCFSFGIPVDRLVIFNTASHPKLSSYLWKWELGKRFREKEVTSDTHYKPDEPVVQLMEGKVTEFRRRGGVQDTLSSSKWLIDQDFQDYFALPIVHRGEPRGAIAWSTKSALGFNEDHIDVFRKSMIVFSPVLRCYTNEAIISSFLTRFEADVREQTMALSAANKCLAEANAKIVRQAESQLRNFAMMSHEIRTPLNCIVGLSNLLLGSDDLDPALKESIELITSSGDLLLAVVDDVLDYSKLAAGKVETKIETVQTHQVIRAVVTSVDIRAKSTGVRIRAVLADNLPPFFETDGRRLQQILYNLLGNAIKFGREGRVVDFQVDVITHDACTRETQEICDERDSSASEDDMIRFTIKDYGKGIHESELPKIFQPFQQAATNDPSHGGTGLGLAITRQLVRVLGGTISVESEYGSWCKFTLLLPRDPQRPIVTSSFDDRQDHVDETMLVPGSTGSQRSTLGNSCYFEDDDFSSSDDDTCSSCTSWSAPSNHAYKPDVANFQHISRPKLPKFFPSQGHETNPKHENELLQTKKTTGETNVRLSGDTIFTIDEIKNLLSSTREDRRDTRIAPTLGNQETELLIPSQEPESIGVTQANRKPIELEKLQVMIAEDNHINQKVLHRTLTRIGIKDIDIVNNGQQAVDAHEKKGYDIIFMDLQMPIMDGLEATGIITSRKKARNEIFPKIAFLTAHALQDYQDKAAQSGGDGFISKPFKMDILKELITRFMET